jgi:outer membrane protein assembly factor BamB
MTNNDRDAMIKLAISAPPELGAPAGLRSAVFEAVQATRQPRPTPWTRLLGAVSPSHSRVPVLVGTALLLLALVVGLVLVIGRQPPATPLTTYHGGPDRTGVMPGPGPAGQPRILWDVSRPGPFTFNTMPLVDDGLVLVTDGSGTLAGLDATTGAVHWETHLDSPMRATPTIVGDLLMGGTDAGTVVALHVSDGSPAWTSTLASVPIAASMLYDGRAVYVGGEDGVLRVLDPATGAELWHFTMSGAITRGAAASNGVVYVGASGGEVAAIDTATHQARWTAELGPGEVGTPTVGDGLVYMGRGLQAESGPHDLVALDLATGDLRWSFATASDAQAHVGGLLSGMLYVAGEDASLTALDPTTGDFRWATMLSGSLGTQVSIAGGILYAGTADHAVHAIDATTREELWSIAVTGTPTQQAVIGGRLYLGTNLGRVIAIGGTAG